MLTVLKSEEEKGYNKCIKCEALGVTCDGPNLTAVSPDRFCEWCRLRKEYLGWTNAHLVEISGVSKATVDRIMAGTVTGLNGDTKSRIACALIYGVSSEGKAWGRHPCAMGASVETDSAKQAAALDALKEKYEKKIEELRKAERSKIEHLKEETEFYKNQLVNKDRMLDDRADYLRKKDKVIMALFGVVFLLMFVLIMALVVDFTNPDMGFFWREALASVIK